MAQKILLFFGAVLLVTKVQSALYIHDCSSGVRDVTEETYANFTCGQYSSYLEWSFSRDHQLGNYIGHCSSLSCSSQSASLFTLQAKRTSHQGYESTLYTRNVVRQYDFFLSCNDRDTVATCRLRVKAPAIVKNCDVWISDWQVRRACAVENMYSSDGSYSCKWRVNNEKLPGNFQRPLTQYWLDKNTYLRGVCYSGHPVPVVQDNYTYSININSGLWNTVDTINIVQPGAPKYTCPDVVQEGSSVSCTCTSSNVGSPPAKFVWEGLNTDTFQIQNVQRENSGTMRTCLMTWGLDRFISRQVVLILKVALPVSIVPKSCSVQFLRWKVHGVCTIQWQDQLSRTPECRWRFSYQSGYWSTTAYDLEEIHGSLSFTTADSIRYKRRDCSFEQEMPVIENNYSYSIRVSSHPDDQFSKSLRIVRPGPATLNCPVNVYEGVSVSCKCNSTTVGSPPAEFSWEGANSDTLHLQNLQRQDRDKNYTCQQTWGPNGFIRGATVYNLKVVAPVSIVPNSCSVQLSEWKVSGTCSILWVQAIKNRRCNWMLKNKKNTEELLGVQSGLSYKSMDNVDYVRVICSFVREMPVDDGNYTYSISVSSNSADQFLWSLPIEKPDAPQHNCTKNVLEGSNLTCTCFTLNLGHPPAHIGWAESKKEHLIIEGIKRERNGLVTTCNLTWGDINYTTSYTINVAFGPSETHVSSSEETSGDETKTVLVCKAIDVYPSAVFRWNISCEKETNDENTSRCTLSTARVTDKMAIECTASNKIFKEVSLTSIHVVLPPHNPFQGGIIAGSVAAVLVLAVIVAVIVVVIKRRKVANISQTQTPAVRFAAPTGDLYIIASPATKGKYQNVSKATMNTSSTAKNSSGYQTRDNAHTTDEEMESNKMAIKPKPTRFVTGYINVTEVLTDSGLGVYHVVPRAAMSEAVGSDAKVLDTSEDEYNVLRFQEDRTGQEEHAAIYSHLDIE